MSRSQGIGKGTRHPEQVSVRHSDGGRHSPLFVVIRHRYIRRSVRVLLPNRPRALLLRGGWASKRFLALVRSHPPCCWHVVMMIIRDLARSAVTCFLLFLGLIRRRLL